MLHFLAGVLLSLSAALFGSGPPLPDPDPNPIVMTTVVDGVVVNVHANLTLSTFDYIPEENVLLTSFAASGALPGGPNDQLPTLTTSWVDAQGVTHTVATPIPSTTPDGLQRATDLHRRLVGILQAAHPPRPVPPP